MPGTQRTASPTAQPAWLRDAPSELRAIFEIGYEKFGDDPAAIADWLVKLQDYRQFWTLVEASSSDDTLARYEEAHSLRRRIAVARTHPELRSPRPPRRTA